jgi:hypothetical protein
VVDDEIDRNERVDPPRVAAHGLHRVAHGGEIHHGRHPGEVLHQHARRVVGDLARGVVAALPLGDVQDIGLGDDPPVHLAQQVLDQDADRERQPADLGDALLLQQGDVDEPVFLPLDDGLADEIGLLHAIPLLDRYCPTGRAFRRFTRQGSGFRVQPESRFLPER